MEWFRIAAIAAVLVLGGCSGSSPDHAVDSPTPPAPGDTTGDPPADPSDPPDDPVDPPSDPVDDPIDDPAEDPVDPVLSCRDEFTVEKVASGQDCAPVAETYCSVANLDVLAPSPLPCDGVTWEPITVEAAGYRSTYLAIHPESGPVDAVVLALHYLNSNPGTFSNVARLGELAKARRVLVVAPEAPTSLGIDSRWPTSSTRDDVDGVAEFLRGVVADARHRYGENAAPLYVAGLSNGAQMALQFACRSTDIVRGVIAVAINLGTQALDDCAPGGSLGSVLVNGTGDALTPYGGIPLLYVGAPDLHAFFSANNHCNGEGGEVALPAVNDSMTVSIRYTGACDDERRDFLVTIDGGGHNWPGGSIDDSDLTAIGLLGAHTRNFDATLQGYDLLRTSGG